MRNYLFYLFLFTATILLFFTSCKKKPCEDISCENNGECIDGTCKCPEGFAGVQCEQLDISSFFGNYTASNDCGAGASSSELGIGEANNGDFELLFISLGDYDCPSSQDRRVRIFAHLEGQNIQIPSQVICAKDAFKGYTYTGRGRKQGDTIRLDFSVMYETGVGNRRDSCHTDLVKK